MRHDYKVLILSLNGLAKVPPSSATSGQPVSKFRLWTLRLLVTFLRVLGYKQTSVSEASACTEGRYYCPVIDIHDLNTLAEFNTIRDLFPSATIFIAPAFTSQLSTSDRAKIWGAFRDMDRSGLEMGLAGYQYVNLTALRHSAQRSQISRSAQVIGRHIGRKPRVAAFPTGTFDATTISCCKESGIELGISHKGLFEIAGRPGHVAPKVSAADLSLKSLASILTFNYKRTPVAPSASNHSEQ